MAKEGVKDSRLPVTTATPEPYLFVPIPTVQLPNRYPVLDLLGSFSHWVYEDQARELLKNRKVRILQRKPGKGKIIGLEMIPDPDMPADQIISRKKFFGLPHRRDTEDNPPNVWTQDKMGRTSKGKPNKHARFCRDVCKAVVIDCVTEYRQEYDPATWKKAA